MEKNLSVCFLEVIISRTLIRYSGHGASFGKELGQSARMKWSGLISAIVLASGSFVVFSPYPVKEEERMRRMVFSGVF